MARNVAGPARAQSCIARALAAGKWTIVLEKLASINLVALSAFAGELTALLGPAGTWDNGYIRAARPGDRVVWTRRLLRYSRTLSGTSLQRRRQGSRRAWP
jgi:hypothetical protein